MIDVATARQTREAEEKIFSKGITPIELMGSVGRFLSEELSEYNDILFLCGTGNNAGDGYAAAELLLRADKNVTLWIPNKKFSSAGEYYFNKCQILGVKCIFGYQNGNISRYDVIVDCLFGIGFHGAVSEETASLIERINASGKRVISADIPSGLNADNGCADVAIVADKVVTVGFAKYGLYLNAGKDYAKNVAVLPLGFEGEVGKLLEPKDCAEFVCQRENDAHKGTYGYVGIFGGSENYTGAVKLANLACAAAYSGSGVIKLVVPEKIMDAVAPYLLESTLFSESQYLSAIKGLSCIGIGCGWGRDESRVELLKAVINVASCPIVLDADGLFAWKKLGLPDYSNRLIITPHYAEMARLADLSVEEVRLDPVKTAMDFSLRHGCITVLKGPSTVITDGKNIYLTNRGCAGMATAGSGDVLLGVMTAVVGQKFENLLKSVAYATIINGIAGEFAQQKYTDIGMTAKDTSDFLRP
ncbi:MAG: NAD(P)H-hydrate dehydratase, partial [Clostridia bacterium]|nr:NAD(P)H-hydrate dehydratase [Clostridia bacterium]